MGEMENISIDELFPLIQECFMKYSILYEKLKTTEPDLDEAGFLTTFPLQIAAAIVGDFGFDEALRIAKAIKSLEVKHYGK